jgi:hypothetical protein
LVHNVNEKLSLDEAFRSFQFFHLLHLALMSPPLTFLPPRLASPEVLTAPVKTTISHHEAQITWQTMPSRYAAYLQITQI